MVVRVQNSMKGQPLECHAVARQTVTASCTVIVPTSCVIFGLEIAEQSEGPGLED